MEGRQRFQGVAEERFVSLTALGCGSFGVPPSVAPPPPAFDRDQGERSDNRNEDFHELQVCHFSVAQSPRSAAGDSAPLGELATRSVTPT